jgi:hypothetical protein
MTSMDYVAPSLQSCDHPIPLIWLISPKPYAQGLERRHKFARLLKLDQALGGLKSWRQLLEYKSTLWARPKLPAFQLICVRLARPGSQPLLLFQGAIFLENLFQSQQGMIVSRAGFCG